MPSNRFDTSVQQQYVSQYVPMPFEAIGALGAQTQAAHEKSLKDLEVTDPIAKLNPRTTFRVYDASAPEGVRDVNLDWTQQRDQALNVLNAEKNKITDEYMQSGDVETFKRKSREYLNKATQVHSDLSVKEAVAKQITDYNKELAKNGNFSLQGHLGQKLLDYNTQFLKDAADPEKPLREYNPYNIAAPTDRPEEVKKYFSGMGREIFDSFSDPTNTGYIRTKYREGLSGDKISKAFNSWYQHSKVQDDIRLEALDFAARHGIEDTQAKVKIQVPVSKDAKGNITYKEEEMPWIDAYEERAFNQVKDMALGFKSSSGRDAVTGDASYWKALGRSEEKENENRALVGQPLESQTFKEFLIKDPKYKDLLDLGILDKTAEGVKIDFTKLNTTNVPTGYSTISMGPGMGVVTTTGKTVPSSEKYNKLNTLMKEMATSINYSKPVKADNYQDILNKYNEYDKVRLFDEQMAAPVSKIETSKAERNWNNYDVMSPDDPTNPLPNENKPKFSKNEGDILILNNWRTAPNGKMNRDGYIKRKDGSIEPIMIRPKAVIDDGYHNNIAELNLTGIKYESGQLKGKPTKDGLSESLAVKEIPGIGTIQILGIKNAAEGNKKTTIYKLFPTDAKGNLIGEPKVYKTQADFQQDMNFRYYGTQAGYADRQSIASPKQTYESTEVPEETEIPE